MKTTVDIANALLSEAQELAAKEKTTLKELVNEGLRKVVQERKTRVPFKLRDCSFGGGGLTPEYENATWEEKLKMIYGDRA